jgi:prolyl-tRNA editing enzyme YbaK/EbsC (Cys-tRNA(Pro) deacylase)
MVLSFSANLSTLGLPVLSSGRVKVEDWIKSRGLGWRVLVMPSTTRTVDDAARALGVSRDVIVKTLVVTCRDAILAVIIPGGRRLDVSKLRGIARDCRLARPDEVEVLTGYPVGGVPPIALPEGVKVILDRSLLDRDVVYGGGGDVNLLLEFQPRVLVELGLAMVLDVSS